MVNPIDFSPVPSQDLRARAFDPTELLLGPKRRVNQFVLKRRLGKGASASVWLAYEEHGGEQFREVALKLFVMDRHDARHDPDGTMGPGTRVVQEAQMLCQINHPNVVSFYALEYVPEANVLALAMEFLAGRTLGERLSETPCLPIAEVVKIGSAIAAALTEIHRANLVHRDVKPANIVASGTTYKLIDFGIAATLKRSPGDPTIIDGIPIEAGAAGPNSGDSTNRRLFGTPGYIDPEHYEKGQEPTALSDIYSLGATLYEAVTGVRPAVTQGGVDREVLRGRAAPVAVTARGVALPRPLANLIMRMLDPDPTKRPPQARVVQAECDAIGRFLESRGVNTVDDNESGFRGLAPYGADEAKVFFWRDNEVATALKLLESGPLLVVQGRMGSGKTSFVSAGVMPRIVAGALGVYPSRWHTCRLRAVSGVVAQIFGELQMEHCPPGDLLDRLLTHTGEKQVGYCLFLDDADGLVKLGESEQAWLMALIREVIDFPQSCFRLILGVSENRSLSVQLLDSLINRTLPLTSIPPAAWSMVIERTVAAYGYKFENDSLKQRIVAEAQERSVSVGLTQFALKELWELRDRERKLITTVGWSIVGGISGAIARHANRTLEKIDEELSGGGDIARGVLVRLVAPDGTRENLRRDDLLRAFPTAEQVLERLLSARLVKEIDGRIRIVHQLLIDNWLLLNDWAMSARAGATFRRSLVSAAADFAQNHRPGSLWRGQELQRALTLPRATLSVEAQDFIDESIARSRQRALQGLVGGVLLGALALAALGLFMYWERQRTIQTTFKGEQKVDVASVEKKQALDTVLKAFLDLSDQDQEQVTQVVLQERARKQAGQRQAAGVDAAPPPGPVAPAPLPHVTPKAAGPIPAAKSGALAAPAAVATPSATPLPAPTPPATGSVPQQVAGLASGCRVRGRAGATQSFVNVIVRGDGSVGWIRFEGDVSPAERACTESQLKQHAFPKHEGDLTLVRVPLPQPVP